jgi:hypothetical protein
VNRQGTIHIVQVSKATPLPTMDRYQVGFADYSSPGGAMKTKEIVGEHALRDFFTSIGVKPMVAESAIRGLRSEGSASVLSVVLPEEMLIRLGLADPKGQEVFSVRFTVFGGDPAGPVLAYCLDAPFVPVSFSSKGGAQYANTESLIRALENVGLPGREVVRAVGGRYTVTAKQLSALGLKPPEW